ncbi:MAG: VWA domain-containing protein [Desulfurococcaceae archaeon]
MIVSSNIRSKVRTAIALLQQKLSGHFSSLLPHMEFLLSEAVPIAGISYNHVRAHIYINPSWLETAHEGEVAGVLLHEALHFVFGHKYREEALPPHLRPTNSIESMLFNVCADYGINEFVRAMGFPLPKGAVDFQALKDIAKQLGVELTNEERGKPTEYYYTKFIHALRQNSSIALNLPQNFDEHIDDPELQEEQEQGQEGQTQGQGQDKQGQRQNGQKQKEKGQGQEGQRQEGEEEQEGKGQKGKQVQEGQEGQGQKKTKEKADFERLKAHMDELKENLLRELRENLKGQGYEGLGSMIKLDSERREVRVESVEQVLTQVLSGALKKLIKEGEEPVGLSKKTMRDISWGKNTVVNYRFNHEPKDKLRFVFVVDTSGSMSPKEVGNFLDMLVSLINHLNRFARSRFNLDLNRFLEITYMEADAKVSEIKVFNSAEELLSYVKHKDSYKGGGGTSFRPALEKVLSLEKPPEVVIYFTDGEEWDVKNYLSEIAKAFEKEDISLVFTLTQRGTEDALKQALEECNVGNISLTRFEGESPAVGMKP